VLKESRLVLQIGESSAQHAKEPTPTNRTPLKQESIMHREI
jgi:hypothetical protein